MMNVEHENVETTTGSFAEVIIMLAIALIVVVVAFGDRKETVCKGGVEYFTDGYGYPSSPVVDSTTKQFKTCIEGEK